MGFLLMWKIYIIVHHYRSKPLKPSLVLQVELSTPIIQSNHPFLCNVYWQVWWPLRGKAHQCHLRTPGLSVPRLYSCGWHIILPLMHLPACHLAMLQRTFFMLFKHLWYPYSPNTKGISTCVTLTHSMNHCFMFNVKESP